MSDEAKPPTPVQAAARRQQQCEDAYRNGWAWRASGRDRDGNPWLDGPVVASVSREAYDRRLMRTRQRTDEEMDAAINDAKADASHRKEPWWDGYDGAAALALRIGEEAMRNTPVSVPPERYRSLTYADHPAFFGEDEVPQVKRSRLSESARLHRWQGTRAAPILPDEQ